MNDEERRIRSYLQAQAAKLSPEEIVDKVRAATAQLQAAAAAVPAARFQERPSPSEWSASEVLAHVVAAGRHFGDQIVQILDGLAPTATPRPPSDVGRTAAQWAAMLDADRAALFERALAADPSARLDETIHHGMFGPLNWRQTLLFFRLHDLDHAGQLQEIAAAFMGAGSH